MATSSGVCCVPMHLQAFTLNDSVASDPDAKIAPITQPNYTFLRFNENLPASDVQENVDLHWTSPAARNSRVTDLGTGLPRNYRKGIYLSWTPPRFYRSGSAASANNVGNPGATSGPDHNVPTFRAAPSRWFVVRHIATGSTTPSITDQGVINKIQDTAWVVESNRVWTIQDLDDLDDANQAKANAKTNFVPVDMQVDVSPFISPSQVNDKGNLAKQSEIFLGCRTAIEDWKPDVANESDGKQRIKPLSLLNSSNPFFADFQHHNGNCFSILDNFAYLDSQGNLQHLTAATASYYVLGWHADPKEDALAIPGTAAQRLKDLNLVFNGAEANAKVTGWFGKATTTMCHGALYEVKWDLNKLPTPLPAKLESNALNTTTPNEPVSLGTTPTDALIAYIAAHKDTDSGDLKELENDIWSLRQLLVAQNDSADALLEAHDQLYNYGFERSDGGGEWHFSGDTAGVIPSSNNKQSMVKLGQLQSALDNATRTFQSLQWQLFSVWWRLVSGASTDRTTVKNNEVTPLVKRLLTLKGSSKDDANSIQWLRDQVLQLTDVTKNPGFGVEKGTAEPFYLGKDPTLLIGGISPGWPADYLDALACRMDGELSTQQPTLSAEWASFVNTYAPAAVKKLPTTIRNAATSLLNEFVSLSSSNTVVPGGPLYHDFGPPAIAPDQSKLLRDGWYGQPWFPLFVEWEAEYYHIPYNNWTLDPTVTLGTSNTNPILQYGIANNINLSTAANMEQRVIQGRTLLLPQPGFSLKNTIDQLLQKMTDIDLKAAGLDPTERSFLNTKLAVLPYLSMPLSGLRQHLLTQIPGTHIKPNQRAPGQRPTPMSAAADPNSATASAGLDSNALSLIGTETALTPYGRGLESLATVNFDKFSLFKPVTHGQLRFNRLNVIDKFGQAICALDPTPSHPRQHLAPALASNYKVEPLSDRTPNVVVKDVIKDKNGKVLKFANEFVQLGPRINQPSRINAAPVVQDTPAVDSKGRLRWRPAYEWENPVYGWVVNNYLDNSIQIFEQDGTFYREITLGGFTGDLVSPAWLPFDKPAASKVPTQLDQLIGKLGDQSYLQAFMNMLNASTNDLPPAPASYAQFMNAVISKPLALVNLGWSLELSTPPLHNESTLNRIEPTMTLLDPKTPELPCGRDSAKKPTIPSLQTRYTFPLKIGDATRTYDGLIGYFLPLVSTKPSPQTPFDLSHLYTYWPTPNAPTVAMSHDSYLPLQAFQASPDSFIDTSATPDPTKGTKLKSPADLDSERNSNLFVVSAIVDPFTAVHGYNGILPVSSLKLPEWVVQSALTTMTAFFHIGPLLVTQDVPTYQSSMGLKSDNPDQTVPGSGVGVPAVGVGDWQWLQPCDDPTQTGVAPKFMGLATKKVDSMPRFENSPYTAIEGYLRLKKPLAQAQ